MLTSPTSLVPILVAPGAARMDATRQQGQLYPARGLDDQGGRRTGRGLAARVEEAVGPGPRLGVPRRHDLQACTRACDLIARGSGCLGRTGGGAGSSAFLR